MTVCFQSSCNINTGFLVLFGFLLYDYKCFLGCLVGMGQIMDPHPGSADTIPKDELAHLLSQGPFWWWRKWGPLLFSSVWGGDPADVDIEEGKSCQQMWGQGMNSPAPLSLLLQPDQSLRPITALLVDQGMYLPTRSLLGSPFLCPLSKQRKLFLLAF